jgi:hypothetical protein
MGKVEATLPRGQIAGVGWSPGVFKQIGFMQYMGPCVPVRRSRARQQTCYQDHHGDCWSNNHSATMLRL